MPAYLVDTVEVEGVSISCKKRNLLADDDDEGLGWFDFEAENSIAVSTGVRAREALGPESFWRLGKGMAQG